MTRAEKLSTFLWAVTGAALLALVVYCCGCSGAQKQALSADAAACKRDAIAIARNPALSCQQVLEQLFGLMQQPACAAIVEDAGRRDAVKVGDVTLVCDGGAK